MKSIHSISIYYKNKANKKPPKLLIIPMIYHNNS